MTENIPENQADFDQIEWVTWLEKSTSMTLWELVAVLIKSLIALISVPHALRVMGLEQANWMAYGGAAVLELTFLWHLLSLSFGRLRSWWQIGISTVTTAMLALGMAVNMASAAAIHRFDTSELVGMPVFIDFWQVYGIWGLLMMAVVSTGIVEAIHPGKIQLIRDAMHKAKLAFDGFLAKQEEQRSKNNKRLAGIKGAAMRAQAEAQILKENLLLQVEQKKIEAEQKKNTLRRDADLAEKLEEMVNGGIDVYLASDEFKAEFDVEVQTNIEKRLAKVMGVRRRAKK